MAHVIPLGIHNPSALQYLVQEGLLPLDPAPSSYEWRSYGEKVGELLWTTNCVVHSRDSHVQQVFRHDKLDEQVRTAFIARFKQQGGRPERAIVIVAGKELHIHFTTGPSCALGLPFEIEGVFPAAEGFLLQRRAQARPPVNSNGARTQASIQVQQTRLSPYRRSPLGPGRGIWNNSLLDSPGTRRLSTLPVIGIQASDEDSDDLPHLFSLSDPLADFCAVASATMAPVPRHLRNGEMDFLVEYDDLDASEKLVYVSQCDELAAESSAETAEPLQLMVTRNDELGQFTVWQGWYFKAKELAPAVTNRNQSKQSRARRANSLAASFATPGTQTPGVRFDDLRRESFAASIHPPNKKPARKSKRSHVDGSAKNEDEDVMRSRLDPDFQANQKPLKGARKSGSFLSRADLGTLEQSRALAGQGAAYAGTGKRGPSLRMSQDRRSFGTSIYRKSRGSMAASTFSKSLGGKDDDSVDMDSDWLIDESDTEMIRASELFAATGDYTSIDSAFAPAAEGIRPEFIVRKVHVFPFRSSSVSAVPGSSSDTKVRTLVRRLTTPSSEPILTMWILGRASRVCIQADFQIMSAPTAPAGSSAGQNLLVPIYRTSSESAGIRDIAKLRHADATAVIGLSDEELNILLQTGLPLSVPTPTKFNVFDVTDVRNSISQAVREVGVKRSIEVQGSLQRLDEGPSEGQLCFTAADGTRLTAQLNLRPEHNLVANALEVTRSALTGKAREVFMLIWTRSCSFLQHEYYLATNRSFVEHQALIMTLLSFAIGSLGQSSSRTPLKSRPAHARLSSSSGTATELGALSMTSSAGLTAWDMLQAESSLKSGKIQTSHPVPESRKHNNKLSHISFVDVEANTRTMLHVLSANGLGWLLSPEANSVRLQYSVQIISSVQDYIAELKLLHATSSQHLLMTRLLTACLAQMGHYLQVDSLDWSAENSLGIDYGFADCGFSKSIVADVSTIADSRRKLTEKSKSPSIVFSNGTHSSTTPAAELSRFKLARELEHISESLNDQTSKDMDVLLISRLAQTLLETMPESSSITLREAIARCQDKPPSTWPATLLRLVGREDAFAGSTRTKAHPATIQTMSILPASDLQTIVSRADRYSPTTKSHEADRHAVIVQIFSEDRRFVDAARLINPSLLQVAECPPRQEWSDIDHLDQQKRVMQWVMNRTIALPAGNAMVHFESQRPLISEKFHVPGFSMLCQMKPMDNTVSADRSNFTEEKFSWAFFHAGASAGLHISRNAAGIDTSWIVFNKPPELTNRHAGFLLALGLNGHLKTMAKWLAFKYLTPKHTMTSIGLLLGMSASHMGTMDSLITRMLSVHVTRMLPAGAAELNVSPLTQTAGLLGIGMLYCNTQHRRMSEMMLSELEYREVEDIGSTHDMLRDESYRLAAGFALGLMNLGKGNDLRGLHGMNLLERLLLIAAGPRPVDLVHVVDKATAASIIAIAFIYMKSNDASIAHKIDVPDTLSQLDYTRPDTLLLRALTRDLIMWDSIVDQPGWIRSQLPSYCPDLLSQSSAKSLLRSADIPTYNIVAGHAWALSLRFAGSGSVAARDEILAYLRVLWEVSQQEALYYDAQLTRTTVRRCIDILALSAATVMAGTGDLVTFRYLRRLHGRTDEETTYGSHMAAHLAIGALFLGGGTYTFATSNLAVAALVMAFYPLFPSDVLDNAVHLQAFRHLWVLAAEARCIVVLDIDNERPITTQLKITLMTGQESIVNAPCLLPELDTISSVETVDPIYWHAKLDFEANRKHLEAFRNTQTLTVRKAPATAASPLAFSRMLDTLNQAQNKPAWFKMWSWLLKLSAFGEAGVETLDLVIPSSSRSLVHNDERSTILDDKLSLWSDALSWDAARLSNIRSLLRWAARQRSKSTTSSLWLGDEFVEKLKSVIERRMRSLYDEPRDP